MNYYYALLDLPKDLLDAAEAGHTFVQGMGMNAQAVLLNPPTATASPVRDIENGTYSKHNRRE